MTLRLELVGRRMTASGTVSAEPDWPRAMASPARAPPARAAPRTARSPVPTAAPRLIRGGSISLAAAGRPLSDGGWSADVRRTVPLLPLSLVDGPLPPPARRLAPPAR